ncbi:hypothetical protein [Halobacillus litoralis]|uniref:hypothetical protein n=1 Tax=Halobacillus litoralis TaxID=45668 RepID=UPI002493A440|nr:hypothetical protein [Halobacillus litoralis]
MMRPKYIGSYPSESEYSSGHTPFNKEQENLFIQLTRILGYSHEEYNDFPIRYAPDGLILALRNQLTAKIQNGMLNKNEVETVGNLIDLLENKL